MATPMSFAYKADLIFEVMVTQRREARLVIAEPKDIGDTTPCDRCAGTGMFITGTLNGKPVGPGGICYRCRGKGFQSVDDGRRNWGYDNFFASVGNGFGGSTAAVTNDEA